MRIQIKNWYFLLCALLMVSAAGCDQASAILEYFQKDKSASEKPAAIPQAVQPAPQAQPAAQPKKKEAVMTADTLAKVGSWTITLAEFQERLDALKEAMPDYDVDVPENQKILLEELVRQQILVEDAQRSGAADQKEIREAVEEFRRTLIVQQAVENLTKDITVSDAEVQNFYEQNKPELIDPPQWHVREIIFDSKDKANAVLVEVLQGSDFAAAAQQYSVGETAAEGGDLGFVSDVPFPEMANSLLALEEGDVSSVFKGPEDKYYIIKLEEKKDGALIPLEEIKDAIVERLTFEKQQSAILDHIEALRQKIPVETKEGLLEK